MCSSYYCLHDLSPLTRYIIDAFNVGYGHSPNAETVRFLLPMCPIEKPYLFYLLWQLCLRAYTVAACKCLLVLAKCNFSLVHTTIGLDVWGTLVANSESGSFFKRFRKTITCPVDVLYLRTAAIWGWTKPTLACVAAANMVGEISYSFGVGALSLRVNL